MEYSYAQYIDGRWTEARDGGTWNVLNPATEETIRTVPYGDGADCRLALEAAQRAFGAWSHSTAYERAAVLQRLAGLIRESADTLAQTTVLESGKPTVQARGEWMVAADLFEWFSEEGKRAYGRIIPSRNAARRLHVLRQPLGVVGIITAWNFPIYNLARAGAAALAAGCTVVFRPSEYTPLTAMELLNLMAEAGLPAGVGNLINGHPASMAAEMLDNPICAKIHFTGSQRVGRLLMEGASKTITRLSLELGGNAPVIVCADVDLDQVAAGAVTAKFRNAGQVCVSPQRFLVHGSVAEPFARRVATMAAALKVGNGLEPTTNVGPLINAVQRDRVEAAVAESVREGSTILAGGGRPADHQRGYFYEPTVLAQVDPASSLFRNELFGPVLPVTAFQEFVEAIHLANSTRYGLAAYVLTNQLDSARRAAEELHFGLIGINDWSPQATEGPFTGWKESGIGRESGQEGLDEYLETKLISTGVSAV